MDIGRLPVLKFSRYYPNPKETKVGLDKKSSTKTSFTEFAFGPCTLIREPLANSRANTKPCGLFYCELLDIEQDGMIMKGLEYPTRDRDEYGR